MDIRKLQRAIVDGLEDVKAQDIQVFNTEHLSPLFERVIIASGTSNRQTRALASSVRQTVKARGLPVLSVEGEDNGEWIIVDCGAAVAHIMQPAIRDYYHLEEIWGGKAVRMKLDGGSQVRARPMPVAAELESADPPAEGVARKAARKAPGRSPAGSTPAAASKRAGAARKKSSAATAKKSAGAAAAKKATRARGSAAAPKRPAARSGTRAAEAAKTLVVAAGTARASKVAPARDAPAGPAATKSRSRRR